MNGLTEKKTAMEWKAIFESEAFEEKYGYDGRDLGAVYGKAYTSFKVWAPTAAGVQLNLYHTGSDQEKDAGLAGRCSMEKGAKGVWNCKVEGDLAGVYYTFTIEANGGVHETADIYAKAAGVNGSRSMVVDLSSANPMGWEQDAYRGGYGERPVIYELHIKDFSNDIHSGIRKEYRGKYMAFTEKGTQLAGKSGGYMPTGIDYLKNLGITHVHLLPSYDYGSVDESGDLDNQFNWGYDPVNYNVPEGSYSVNPYDGAIRIREFKEMVKALHEAGLAVVMDVVYNHTYSADSWFQSTVPYYYYRINGKGQLSNGSLCGNDTASERRMFRKYMIDSVCYWAAEYHIDGFRFDLMGLHDVDTMNEIRNALDQLPGGNQILMYGEPWRGSESSMKKGSIPALKEQIDQLDERISIFCDSTRDCIKGSVFYAEKAGFVNGKEGLEEDISSCVLAWCTKRGKFHPRGPGQIISYVSAHDNYTLWDKLVYTAKAKPWDFLEKNPEVLQQNKMAAAIYFTCLGTPFFQAGEEGARTKRGIGDSYASLAEINQLDWARIYEYEELTAFYKGLIEIRKHFGTFYRKDKGVLDNIRFWKVSCANMVCFTMKGDREEADWWEELSVIYYAGLQKEEVGLPQGMWQVLCDGSRVNLKKEGMYASETFTVPGRSVIILGKQVYPK